MKQDLEALKARVNEATQILTLVKYSLEQIDMASAPQEQERAVGYLTMEEAQHYLNMSRTGFYELRNKVHVPCFKVLGRQMFKRDDLDQVMEGLRA